MRLYLIRYSFVLLLLLWSSAGHATSLFGKDELSSSNLRPFKKWLGVLEQYRANAYHISPDALCQKKQEGDCIWDEWNEFLAGLKQHKLLTKLKKVNHFVNEHDYIVDPINWGVKDYWATPQQFNLKNGDCEDYAIAKYISLKAIGVPEEHMRIVILDDRNLDLLHAVLAVYTPDGMIYILDNQIPHVMKHSDIHHYKPVYSINEHYWWKHY